MFFFIVQYCDLENTFSFTSTPILLIFSFKILSRIDSIANQSYSSSLKYCTFIGYCLHAYHILLARYIYINIPDEATQSMARNEIESKRKRYCERERKR